MFATNLFTDRSALVTGAGRGIGEAIAKELAAAGADVAVNDLKRDRATDTAAAIGETGSSTVVVPGDISDPTVATDILAEAASELGEIRHLVNCAGAINGASLRELTTEEWDEVMNINGRGTFIVSREFANRLAGESTSGSIVNIASIAGLQPEIGAGAYSASKAAIVRLTEQMAVEWAEDGLRVNNICPGLIWTPGTNAVYSDQKLHEQRRNLLPTKRIGQPEDIAKAAVFLLAPDNDYVTGETLIVDGGARCVGVTTQIQGIEKTNLR